MVQRILQRRFITRLVIQARDRRESATVRVMNAPARRPIRPLIALLVTLVAMPSFAQTTTTDTAAATASDSFFSGTIPPDPALAGAVRRLSPEQREAAIEAGASRPALGIDGGNGPDHQIHGEVGVAVGTGGYRAAYGTAVVPLGDTGVAAVSVETDRSNYRWRRR